MTNAELISMVRSIAKHDADWRINEVLNRAADALEAEEKRIAELEKQEPTEKQVVDYCHKRCLVIVEEELFHRMKSTFSLLPKEGEWISDYDGFEYDVRCSVCGEEALIKEGGSHDHAYSHYCPNCGAKMIGANDERD